MLGSWLTTLKVDGQLELDLIDVLGRYVLEDALPETLVDASGVADVDLRIEGPSGQPKPIGTVEFNRASFVLRGFSEPIRIQNGAVVFGRESVEIPEDRALVGEALGGVYSLSGNVAMDGYRPGTARLNLWSHNMMYRVAETANVSFDTDLQVDARALLLPRTWDVAGQINVLNALYYRNISLLEQELAGRVIGAFSRRTERYEAGLLDSLPWVGDVQFNVDIRARDGVQIQNRIDRFAVDLGMRLDLKLQQTLRDPRMTGEIDVLDGDVRFQGEIFEVRSGTIEYLGSATNPRVDISAGADIRNRCAESVETQQFDDTFSFSGNFGETERELYHVLLNVQGRLESLDIQLESNPYADQRDILSLMLTGCTVDALTASNASQPGLEIALGPLLGRLEKEVRDVVKLSEFTIMPGIERTEVRIGDRLTRRLVWRFQLDTGLSETAGGQRYQLEYQLSDRWSAELSERSRGETNNFLLDLKLKYRLPLD
jgi:autotransporter translocation and assembly factor TamB